MGDAFEGGCDHEHGDETCPICRGEELNPDFIAMLEQAASAEPVVSMTAEEAVEWLRSL